MRVRLFALAGLAVGVVMVGGASASSPASGSVTVPTTAGQTVSDHWTGTIPPGVNPASDCTGGASPSDEHLIDVHVPTGTYNTVTATFTFSIQWSPPGPENAADEILTVVGPGGNEVGSSDGGTTTETVVASNLAAGVYHVLACGFINAGAQNYSGKLDVTTAPRSTESSLPSAPAQGFRFSAAVPADQQRDEAEPLIEVNKDGYAFTCGPTGFSNASDYAQVSTDGGDQFHLLGTPPRGQQGAGGGGDCGLAHGVTRNADGNFQYAYTGLGPLTGFVTSTSANNGHNLVTGGPFGNGITDKGGGADRQWMTFLDDHTVLLSYNQQEPRNVVVQKSTDGGLTYGPLSAIAAPDPRFPGPMRYDKSHDVAFFGWDRPASDGDHVNLSVSHDGGATWTDCLAAVAPGDTTLFVTADSDRAGNVYLAYGEKAKYHTYLVTLTADKVSACDNPAANGRQPTENPGFSAPVQVDRDAVRTTVFPWVAAGGAPGRVAVSFYGTETDGNPNTGAFKASWNVYVNQSLNALSPDRTFSQVKATTHPFHYDSICLNGLGCDLSVPTGDRSLADFFSIDYNPVSKRLQVVFNRAEKKPDEAAGHVANPIVVSQIGGPSNGGGTISVMRKVVRNSSSDPAGDALSAYSLLGTPTPPPPTTNEPAGDFLSVKVGPQVDLTTGERVQKGGFTVTMKVAELSNGALARTMAATGSQSLLWAFRFVNGYQAAAVSARYNPVQGFTFGYNNYTTGNAPCAGAAENDGDKCVVYPGGVSVQGKVDQAAGTIKLSVPLRLLRQLKGPTGNGQRPLAVAASPGARFYDAEAWSLGNTLSPTQDAQSFLYPLDNTAGMDFVLATP